MDLKAAIIQTGQRLIKHGLVAGTWGNVSSRSDDSNRIAITPSGQPYDSLTPADIVIVDPQGNLLEGINPSSELILHLAIYRARPDVRAIVHTHSLYATACAVAGEAIPPCLEEFVQAVGGSVNVAQYALPGTLELAANAVSSLEDRSAVLLSNHGAVACGPSLHEALLVAQLVEKAAQIHVISRQLGSVRPLDEADVQQMRRFYLEKYMQRGSNS
jgi:L-ribulose-5-phosphate 4-epimerase